MSNQRSPISPSDVVPELRRTAGELASLAARLPVGRLPATTAEGDWSASEVIAHLAHFEVLAGARIRMVLTQDRPPLAAFDQVEFNRRFADLLPLDAALALFQVNRAVNCAMLDRLGAGDWERIGLHPVRGEETLARTMAMLIRHDDDHLEQMRRAVDTPE